MAPKKQIKKAPAPSGGKAKDDHVGIIVSSFISGMIARVPMHPVDTVKAQMQVSPSAKTAGIYNTFASVLRQQGVRGLYPGFPTVFIGSAPAGALFFGTYESSKKYLDSIDYFQKHPALGHFVSGFSAETISCMLWVPIDVVKERLQVQRYVVQEPSLRYKGDWHAIKTIAKTEGFRGIYKGYGATLASFGPFSAVYMTLYEEMKAQACVVLDKPTEAELPFACFWGGGALAGSISAFVTSPLDMAKLRIQVDRGSSKVFTYGYRNVLDGVRQIWRQDGVKGLFRGSAARVAFHGPSTGITIGLYDSVKTWVNTLRDQEQL